MRPSPASSLLAAASLAVASPALVQQQQNPRSPAPGVIQFDIARRHELQGLTRRATDTASLLNNITNGAYVTTVKVGKPQQTLTLQVDTGSSDTWLPSSGAQICQSGGCFYGSCKSCLGGVFFLAVLDGAGAKGNRDC